MCNVIKMYGETVQYVCWYVAIEFNPVSFLNIAVFYIKFRTLEIRDDCYHMLFRLMLFVSKHKLFSESSSIQVNKAASVQIPGMGQLQKQQLQMLLQAKMLQQQNQDPTNIATDATLIDPVTPPPNDWSTIFGGNTANTVNTANTGAAAGKARPA